MSAADPRAFVSWVEEQLYDVAFALNARLPPLDALPDGTRNWLRRRALDFAYTVLTGEEGDYPSTGESARRHLCRS